MQLLLVIPYQPMRRALKSGLEEEGHQVDTALGWQEATRRLRSARYDVIVLDLPEPSLADAVGVWRESDVRTPILLLVSPDRVEVPRNEFDWGIVEVLALPFRLEDLMARLRALCARNPGEDGERAGGA
jgi:two-component system OmpR family response regulator